MVLSFIKKERTSSLDIKYIQKKSKVQILKQKYK